jgi:hypothetical protein
VRKDLNLNLSAVHENIRNSAYGQRFRNWFRVKASGSIGPMCFKSGAVTCALPIVRDESSRVFLGGALQQSPPLRRPSSMVGQISREVNRKDEAAVRRRPAAACHQNRQKCGRFIPALTVMQYPAVESVLEMPLAQQDEEIQALPADRSHHTLADGVGDRRLLHLKVTLRRDVSG